MNLTLKALKFLGGLFAKGTVLASAWALSIVLVMTSANAMDVLCHWNKNRGCQYPQRPEAARKANENSNERSRKEYGQAYQAHLSCEHGRRTYRMVSLVGDAVAMGAMGMRPF